MSVTVLRAGFLTTVQDLGRNGFRRHGVTSGGALDSHALKVANLLAGNEKSAAGLEVTLGSMRLRFGDDRIVAWCGGKFDVRIADTELPTGCAGFITRGEELQIIAPEAGGRIWLAISGGIDVPVVLGSRATDLRSAFGGHQGRMLRDGDLLALGAWSETAAGIAGELRQRRVSNWSAPHRWSHPGGTAWLRFVRGSDWSRFAPQAQAQFVRAQFSVTPDSDRMGARLEGVALRRRDEQELTSEPVAFGAVQVPPDGNPIILLGDCQTIGGYPKIAHVITVDLPIAAQLRPGRSVGFIEAPLADAQALLVQREKDFEQFRIGLSLRMRC